MIRFILKLSIFFSLSIIGSCSIIKKSKLAPYKIEGFAQGTSYQITYYAERAVISSNSINHIFNELDSSLSIYKPYSLINQFNNSQNGIIMDEHLNKVVQRSLKIWKESEGVFDISILPIVEVWGFGAKKHSHHPTDAEIATELARLQAQYDANEYQRQRAQEYPSIADQLDTLYHSGLDAWKAQIKTVKDKFPKV